MSCEAFFPLDAPKTFSEILIYIFLLYALVIRYLMKDFNISEVENWCSLSMLSTDEMAECLMKQNNLT